MPIEFNTASELSVHELELQAVEPLPDRAAMSLVNANLAVPVNLALAANVAYSVPGSLIVGGTWYVSLTALHADGPAAIVIVASDDHGAH